MASALTHTLIYWCIYSRLGQFNEFDEQGYEHSSLKKLGPFCKENDFACQISTRLSTSRLSTSTKNS